MTMQEGIGRGGYRILALVFLALGVLGLASTVYAFQQPSPGFFNGLGFVLAFVALAAMFGLTLMLLRREGHAEKAAEVPKFTRIQSEPVEPVPDYEFPEEVAMPMPEPESEPELIAQEPERRFPPALSTMSPRAPRPFNPVPEPERSAAFERLPSPEMWAPPEQPRASPIAPPLKRAPSGMTMGEKRAMERAQRAAPPVVEEPQEVAIPIAKGAPAKASFKVVSTVLAKLAPTEGATPDGLMRGKCSQCETLILAPKNRPINVRCPRCDKVTLLNR